MNLEEYECYILCKNCRRVIVHDLDIVGPIFSQMEPVAIVVKAEILVIGMKIQRVNISVIDLFYFYHQFISCEQNNVLPWTQRYECPSCRFLLSFTEENVPLEVTQYEPTDGVIILNLNAMEF